MTETQEAAAAVAREERTDLVYAMKIRVKNDNGVLKIGMPVDVQLGAAGEASK